MVYSFLRETRQGGCNFPRKINRMLPNPSLASHVYAAPRGQPNGTGPIANSRCPFERGLERGFLSDKPPPFLRHFPLLKVLNAWEERNNACKDVHAYKQKGRCIKITFIREQKRHIKLLHIKLFPVAPSPVFLVGYPDKRIYVAWVPRIVHKTLTPGLPVGRPPGHRRGSPAKKIYVYVPFSFLKWFVYSAV